MQCLKFFVNLWERSKVFEGLLNIQVQTVGDRLTLELNLQSWASVSFAFADWARDPHVC